MKSLPGRCFGLIVWPPCFFLGTSSRRGWRAFMTRLAKAAIKDPPYFFWGAFRESPHHQGGSPFPVKTGGGHFFWSTRWF